MVEDVQQPPQSTPATSPINRLSTRVPAFSVKGDTIHQLCLPVLEHLIEHGTEEERARAQATKDNWDGLQDSIIKWGNDSGYFNFCQQAMADPKKFRKLIDSLPGENMDKTILLLALEAGIRLMRPKGIKGMKREKK